MFYNIGPCTIKHYESVIYGKMTTFVVSWHLLAWTNTLAYYRVHTLRTRNVFIVQAPGVLNPGKPFQSSVVFETRVKVTDSDKHPKQAQLACKYKTTINSVSPRSQFHT